MVLPPIIGGVGSLNMLVGLVGPSGAGKGASEAVAKDAFRCTCPLPHDVWAEHRCGQIHTHTAPTNIAPPLRPTDDPDVPPPVLRRDDDPSPHPRLQQHHQSPEAQSASAKCASRHDKAAASEPRPAGPHAGERRPSSALRRGTTRRHRPARGLHGASRQRIDG